MPRGGHDIPVSGTHLKGTQWLRRVDPTVSHLKGTPWSRRVWTPHIYIYIYIFCGFPIARMRKKIKKKKKGCRKAACLLPIFSLHWVTIQQFVS